MAHTYYYVTAKHVGTYGTKGQVAQVSPCSGYVRGQATELFYCNMQGYGCSKWYRSPEDAIRGMLQEHACTNIQVEECKDQKHAEHVYRNVDRNLHVKHKVILLRTDLTLEMTFDEMMALAGLVQSYQEGYIELRIEEHADEPEEGDLKHIEAIKSVVQKVAALDRFPTEGDVS